MTTAKTADAARPSCSMADNQTHPPLGPILNLPGRLAVVGAFGSGKTEISINLALELARVDQPVTLVDLDAVTPALRSRQAKQVLDGAGVELLGPPGGLSDADSPAVSAGVRAALSRRGRRLLVDVGGHPDGARVLGSLSDLFAGEEHALLGVVCPWRPQTRDARSIEAVLTAISAEARLPITAMAINFHVPGHPEAADLRAAETVALEAAERLGAELCLYAIDHRHLELAWEALGQAKPWLGLELFMRAPWDQAQLGAVSIRQPAVTAAFERRLLARGG